MSLGLTQRREFGIDRSAVDLDIFFFRGRHYWFSFLILNVTDQFFYSPVFFIEFFRIQ